MNQFSKIESLNGIRGFAVLLVLLSHASNEGVNIHPALSFSGAGRYGVFLFFVLSAFLLTRQFLERHPVGNEIVPFVRNYFLRRFLRIFPLYIAALLCYYLLYKLGRGIYDINEAMLLKSIFLLDAEGIFWTIPVEFQYYFLLPLISLVFLHTKRTMLVIIAVSVFTFVWWHIFPPKYVTHLLPFLPIFILGSTAALISYRINTQKEKDLHGFIVRIFNLIALCGVLLFLVLIPGYFNLLFAQNAQRTEFHDQFLLFAVLSSALVLSTVHGNGIVKKIMESKFLVFWGNVSFSAYLGHTIVLTAVRRTAFVPSVKWIIFLTATGILSYLAYKYFEMPLSKVHWVKGASSRISSVLGSTKSSR